MLGVLLVAVVVAAWHIKHSRSAAVSQPIPQTASTPTQPPAPPPPPPDPWHGLKAGPITLTRAEEGDLVYAVGTLKNDSDHERFGVKVELKLFDDEDADAGTATDYVQSISPGKEWKFKALVLNRSASRVELSNVTEEP